MPQAQVATATSLQATQHASRTAPAHSKASIHTAPHKMSQQQRLLPRWIMMQQNVTRTSSRDVDGHGTMCQSFAPHNHQNNAGTAGITLP
eukprot:363925-Chlamydomonas_euryale.AAC.10